MRPVRQMHAYAPTRLAVQRQKRRDVADDGTPTRADQQLPLCEPVHVPPNRRGRQEPDRALRVMPPVIEVVHSIAHMCLIVLNSKRI